jgi:hypothetical protein
MVARDHPYLLFLYLEMRSDELNDALVGEVAIRRLFDRYMEQICPFDENRLAGARCLDLHLNKTLHLKRR